MTDKGCPFSFGSSSGTMQCQEAKCMAWKPELKLELKGIHSVPNEIQELFKQMSGQGLRMEGTMLVIDAHCVLLESKK